MKELLYKGIEVIYSDALEEDEVKEYVDEELKLDKARELWQLRVELLEDQETVMLLPMYNSITRVRRITGYCSNVKNFNEAKRAELDSRVKHFGDDL